MKNTKARMNSGDDWKTPDSFYRELDQKYHFDFDPCPYQSTFDGLSPECIWGEVNFINPPYSRELKEKFVKRAVIEKMKGKTSVMLLPVSTSTKLFHEVILPNADNIEFVKGRLKFEQKDQNGIFRPAMDKNGRAICGQHDSMIIVFKGKN